LEEADVIILMIDAVEGIESQDINIFHLAEKNKKGIMIVVNKWDLIEKNNKTTKVFEDMIREKLRRLQMCLLYLHRLPKSNVY
jgi:GTP-binding protein